MIALCIKQESDPAEREVLLHLVARTMSKSERSNVVLLNPTAWRLAWPPPDGEAISMMAALPEQTFTAVAISPAFRLFPTNWTRALFGRLARSLKPGGQLWAPIAPNPQKHGHVSAAWLRKVLGRRGRIFNAERASLLRVKNPRVIERPSVLQWYYAHQHIWTDASPEQMDFVHYSVFGANYKSVGLGYIIDQCLPERPSLSLLDVGGGFGLTPAETMLTHPRVERATIVDPDTSQQPVAESVTSYFADQFGGRLSYQWQTAQTLEVDESIDVAIFISSLLYVPRKMTDEVLQHTWRLLRPGGLLIVHENIKHPSYKRDYDVMFTVEEIDERLSRFGAIRRFLSTATREVSEEAANEKTVFRVVQKP